MVRVKGKLASSLLVVAIVLGATGCHSGLGLREAPNPWTSFCVHGKAWLAAQSSGGDTGAALDAFASDVRAFKANPYSASWGSALQTVVESARNGKPTNLEDMYKANCLPGGWRASPSPEAS